MKQVAVIGAGIAGITTAYFLARSGYQVTVIDANSAAAQGTSYANGGQLSVSNSQVWTTWPTVLKGLKWLFDPAAPLLIRPRPSWPKLKWLAGFLAATALDKATENTLKTVELGLRARQLYRQIADQENIKFDHLQRGIMHVYKDPALYTQALRTAELYRFAGCDQQAIDTAQAVRLEPALGEATDIIAAMYTPADSTGDARKFCQGLAYVLEKKYAVDFCYSTQVNAIVSSHATVLIEATHCDMNIHMGFDHVVVCAGADSARVANMVGENLNIYPVKGYSITIELEDAASQLAAPSVSILDEQAKIVCSRLGNRLRVAGTAELDDWNKQIRQDRIDPLLTWVNKNFPGVNTANYQAWAGLRPMTPSMLPIVRQSSKSSHIWLNTGHGHLGWTLSAATSKDIVDQIVASAQ